MLEASAVPGTPEWWLKVLATELQDRRQGRLGRHRWSRTTKRATRVRPPLDVLHDHFRGDPPLRGVAEGWEEAFREVTRLGRLNMAELIVTARTDRMGIAGFRTAAAGDELGDKMAADLMAATDLSVKAGEIHDGMGALGDAYAMVLPVERGEKYPTITDEDARHCITAHDPATGKVKAGLKLYRDDYDSADFAQLFIVTADGSVEHRTAINRSAASSINNGKFRMTGGWEWTKVEDENGEAREDVVVLKKMPLIRFRNRRGTGVYEWHLDTLDRINDQILDKLIIAKIQAFRQMAVEGLPDTETKIIDGKPVEVEVDYDGAFLAEPGSLWQVPAGVNFWESAVTDLRPLLQAIKDDLEHLAAGTKTPLHIITPDAAQGSAEGADLMRESNTYAVRRDRQHADVGWRDLISTAFAFMAEADANSDDREDYEERAQKAGIKTVYDPLRSYSLSEMADASSKAGNALPLDAIRRDIWQYAPDELAELRTMDGRDLLRLGGVSAGGQQGPVPLAPTFQRPGQPPAQPPSDAPPAGQ